jgi:hypothetical protein
MTQHTHDNQWRNFPKTATEFEARFATETDCRAYWIEVRWGGKHRLCSMQQHSDVDRT